MSSSIPSTGSPALRRTSAQTNTAGQENIKVGKESLPAYDVSEILTRLLRFVSSLLEEEEHCFIFYLVDRIASITPSTYFR